MKAGKLALSASCWFFIVHEELIEKTRSTLPMQPGGGLSPPSGGVPPSGMPEPAELVELLDAAELAAAESSAELVDVEVEVDVDVSPLELVPWGTVVMLEPNPDGCPSPLLQAARAVRVASAMRRMVVKIARTAGDVTPRGYGRSARRPSMIRQSDHRALSGPPRRRFSATCAGWRQTPRLPGPRARRKRSSLASE
jgi:hypothetical protein